MVEAESTALRAAAEDRAAKIAADDEDGLGEERRAAVLAEAEAAASGAAQSSCLSAILSALGSIHRDRWNMSVVQRIKNLCWDIPLPKLLSGMLCARGCVCQLCIEGGCDVCCTGAKNLKSKLARSGHTANLVGTRVVITGGILRDGSLLVDVVTVDLAKLTVSR